MVIGIAGAVIPGVPGTILIVIAIVVWGAVHGFAGVGLPLAVAIAALVLNMAIDLLASYLGAKHAGASRWGQIGAIIGFLLGFLGLLPALPVGGPLLGMLLGPLIGAIVGEFLFCRDWQRAIKAGFGIVVGSILGNILQGILAAATVIVFLVTTWSQMAG